MMGTGGMRLLTAVATCVAGGCLLVGCGTSVSFVPTARSPKPLRERTAAEVQFLRQEPQDRPFREIGVIQAEQSAQSDETPEEIVALLLEEAGRNGCEAMLLVGRRERLESAPGPDQFGSNSYETYVNDYEAACLVFLPPKLPEAAPVVSAPAPAPTRVCAPNETQLCHGAGACQGAQACQSDGQGWTVCDCGTPAPQPSQPAGAVNAPTPPRVISSPGK